VERTFDIKYTNNNVMSIVISLKEPSRNNRRKIWIEDDPDNSELLLNKLNWVYIETTGGLNK
jgi:hypothetical protein